MYLKISLLQLTNEGQDDGEQGGCREGDGSVELQHLEQLHDEDEDLVLRVPQQHRDGHSLKNKETYYCLTANYFALKWQQEHLTRIKQF